LSLQHNKWSLRFFVGQDHTNFHALLCGLGFFGDEFTVHFDAKLFPRKRRQVELESALVGLGQTAALVFVDNAHKRHKCVTCRRIQSDKVVVAVTPNGNVAVDNAVRIGVVNAQRRHDKRGSWIRRWHLDAARGFFVEQKTDLVVCRKVCDHALDLGLCPLEQREAAPAPDVALDNVQFASCPYHSEHRTLDNITQCGDMLDKAKNRAIRIHHVIVKFNNPFILCHRKCHKKCSTQITAMVFGILAMVIAAMVIYILASIKVVNENKFQLTRFFGRNFRVLHSGINNLLPFESIITLKWESEQEQSNGKTKTVINVMTEFPLSETKLDPPPVAALTKDSVKVSVNGVLWWHVVRSDNMFALVNIVVSPLEQLGMLFDAAIRDVVGSRSLSQLRNSVDGDLALAVQKNLTAQNDGRLPIVIDRVSIQDVHFENTKLVSDLASMAVLKQKMVHQKETLDLEVAVIEAEARNKMARTRADAECLQAVTLASCERDAAYATARADAARKMLVAITSTGVPAADLAKVYDAVSRETLYGKVNEHTTLILSDGHGATPGVSMPIVCNDSGTTCSSMPLGSATTK